MLNGAVTGVFEWVLVENIEAFNSLDFLIKLTRTFASTYDTLDKTVTIMIEKSPDHRGKK